MKTLKLSKLLLCGFAASLLFASCNDKENGSTVEPEESPIVIEAVLPDLGSRVELSEQNVFVWQEGDAISLYYLADDIPVLSNAKFVLSGFDAGKSTGIFQTVDAEWGTGTQHVFYSIYPYSSEYSNLDKGEVQINIPASQTGVSTLSELTQNLIWVARAEYSEQQEKVTLNNTTPVAILKLVLDAKETSIENMLVNSIEFNSDAAIVGNATYDIHTQKASGFTDKTIALNDKITLSENELYLTLYPQDLSAHNTTLTLEGPLFNAQFSLEIGNLHAMDVLTYKLNVKDAIASGDADISIKGDVSSESNTYIVPTNGVIIIPVSRAYNAWSTMPELSGNPLSSRTGDVSVDLIWIDDEAGISGEGVVSSVVYISKNTPETSAIGVTTGSKEGNALIAMFIGDEIVWSWHIWVANFDPEAQNGVINGVTVMDRNLGAVSIKDMDPDAMGLFYQWGRKDPFPPANDNINPETQKQLYDKTGAPYYIASLAQPKYEDENWGIKYAVNNPQTFINNPYDIQYGSSCTWTSSVFIAPNNMKNYLWIDESTGGKTLYDPCPTGWKVPNQYTLFEGYNNDEGFEIGSGMYIEDVYFPSAGFYDCYAYQLLDVGSAVNLWFAGTGGYGGRSFYANYIGAFNPPTITATYRAYGNNVRCVKDI